MIRLNFNLKMPDGNGNCLIMLVCRWGRGRRLNYSTQERIRPQFWENKGKDKRNFQRVRGSRDFPEHVEFNSHLDNIMSTAKSAFRKFLNDNNNRPPDVDEFKKLLDIKLRHAETEGNQSFFDLADQFVEESKTRNNDKTSKPLSPATIGIYANSVATLKRYGMARRISLEFKNIDLDFYQDYVSYLAKDCGYANNYIGKQIKMLKTFLHWATLKGVATNPAFRSSRFKAIAEQTTAIYLTTKELEEMYRLNLTKHPKLSRVRDLFLVQNCCGLRFSDITNIQPENIRGDFFHITMKKTGGKVIIPHHPMVKKIMKKYKNKYPNSLPPAVSNVKMNEYLKEIGAMMPSLHEEVAASITRGGVNVVTIKKKYEMITTHTARRSFATNLYLSDFSSIKIMQLTGHKTEAQFLKYLRQSPKESAIMLQEHWKKNGRKKKAA